MNDKLINLSHSTARPVERIRTNLTRLVASAQWYVVQTKPQQEVRALDQLRQAGYVCFLPTMDTGEGIGASRIEPRFPRYLLVQLDDADSHRTHLHMAPAVSGLLSIQQRPAAVPERLVSGLLKGAGIDASGLLAHGQQDDGVARALGFVEMLSRPLSPGFTPTRMRCVA